MDPEVGWENAGPLIIDEVDVSAAMVSRAIESISSKCCSDVTDGLLGGTEEGEIERGSIGKGGSNAREGVLVRDCALDRVNDISLNSCKWIGDGGNDNFSSNGLIVESLVCFSLKLVFERYGRCDRVFTLLLLSLICSPQLSFELADRLGKCEICEVALLPGREC